MPRTYEVRQDRDDLSKWAVWLCIEGQPDTRAHPGHRFDTRHEADILATALTEAFEAGRREWVGTRVET